MSKFTCGMKNVVVGPRSMHLWENTQHIKNGDPVELVGNIVFNGKPRIIGVIHATAGPDVIGIWDANTGGSFNDIGCNLGFAKTKVTRWVNMFHSKKEGITAGRETFETELGARSCAWKDDRDTWLGTKKIEVEI